MNDVTVMFEKLMEGQVRMQKDILSLKDEIGSLEKRVFGELGKIVMYVQEVDKKVDRLDARVDKAFTELFVMDEDAVVREEFDALKGRVCALEQG